MQDEINALEEEKQIYSNYATRIESIYEKAKQSTRWAMSSDEEWDDFLGSIQNMRDYIKKDLNHAETEISLVKKCEKVMEIDDVEKLKSALKKYVQYDVRMNLKNFALMRLDYQGMLDRLEGFLNKPNE